MENTETIVQESNMDALIRSITIPAPKINDLIDGVVMGQKKSNFYVDIRPYGTGIIYGKEFNNAKETIKSLKPGDVITVKIIELENELGYISLSLKDAKQEIVWREIEDLQKNETLLNIPVLEANKGGLIMEYKGIQGFLPASQLKTGHYPRIEDGDANKILDELKKLVGTPLPVSIISSNQKERKLIFSEKKSGSEELKEVVSKYNLGDIVDCEVTGVVEFGIFVKLEEGLEGLVHISEIDWSLVEDPSEKFKIGDKIKAQIISIKNNKISLSIKVLQPDPWMSISTKYKEGDITKGVVIKFNKHGALVSIEEGISGLVHVSEFKTKEEMQKKLELGKSYHFQITTFDPKEHKLTFKFLEEGSN